MNILVLDVAASESGALTVLNQYYNELQNDIENHYYFCVSTPQIESTRNITVLKFPWIKKSWIHRLWFEFFYVNRLVEKYNAGRVFSLQNLILSNPKCEKWIYLHISLPFTDVEFSLLSDTKIWVYKHVIGRLIKKSLRKADKIIVQTQWMKRALYRAGIDDCKVEVKPPVIQDVDIVKCTNRDAVKKTLFYPATPLKYKNHMIVLEAMNQLKQKGMLGNLQVEFTLTGKENEISENIFGFAKKHNLPVYFLGSLTKEQVMDRYATSTLIFPSYIETFGLPLLEARLSDTWVIASNCSFSQEILNGYDSVMFFNPFDVEDLCAILERLNRDGMGGTIVGI